MLDYGYWGAWGRWSACSKNCHQGYRTRNRFCLFKPYSGPIVKIPCKGHGNHKELCNVNKPCNRKSVLRGHNSDIQCYCLYFDSVAMCNRIISTLCFTQTESVIHCGMIQLIFTETLRSNSYREMSEMYEVVGIYAIYNILKINISGRQICVTY